MVFKARDVRKNLKKKGFVERDDKHHKYLHFQYRGKETHLYTFTSHGKDSEEVGSEIVKSMKRQLGLGTIQQVHQLVECTMTESLYIAELKANGELAKD